MSQFRVLSVIRYTYYAFIFSVPIETLWIGIESGDFSVSKLIGIAFIATALLQPQVCFKMPPRPFWYFLAYILIGAGLAIFQSPQPAMGRLAAQVFTFVLLLVLFWISYNLFQDKSIVKGAFFTLIASCALLTALMWRDPSYTSMAPGRVTAMSFNPNTIAATLAVGLLALLGLAYARTDMDARIMTARVKLLAWLCFGWLAVGLVATGSRKAMIGLLVGVFLLVVKQGNFARKVQVGIIALLAIIALAWTAYDNQVIWSRWEQAFLGDRSGREAIHPEAWNMFMEKPFFGWGLVANARELGARFGWPALDPHSLYLSILTETGLFGSVLFFSGLWICWRAAWRASHGAEGSLPVALMGCLLVVNLAGGLQYRKLFWIILAYSLASQSFVVRRSQRAHPAGAIKESPHPVGYGP